MRISGFWLAVPIILASGGKPQHTAPTGPVVQIASGALQGMQRGSIAVFEGVPFAAAPVGPLRWREPQAVTPWKGVRDATAPSHPCMQNAAGTDNFMLPLAAAYGVTLIRQTLDPSEDCLYLNVWTPKLQAGAHLPVMVWLHGGSNRVGSGTEPGYDGSVLAAHGVVVVTINYRLGVMGFFAHPELTAESPHHSSGNYGLLDQIAALKWVQQNINAFGGDAGNVTLFGESAGSIDATTLMTSALTKDLFRRVIAESGAAFGLGRERSVAEMEPLGVAVGKDAMGGKSGSQLQALRSLPAAQVTDIENRLIATQFKGYDPNASIVDGWVLWESPAKAFASGKIQPVALLAGVNAREFSAFRVVAAEAVKSAHQPVPKPRFSDQLKQFADLARPLYGSWTDFAVATYTGRIMVHGSPAVDQASNDILGACPVGAEAALTTRAGQRAYVYRFDRSVPGKGESELRAFHSLELPYVFGTFQARTFSWLPFNATDQKLAQTMQGYWTNFAKTGDPNGPGLPQWTPWNASQEPFVVFSQSGDAKPQKNFAPIYCHLAPERLNRQLINY
ncbi:carboxylesterase family protein [Telmatobacter sp. DSM 110680]|uniref:Carboxylic ester hydrolase n=1 Tax=Telmatobacter sp. DSM 110680 TaxID=3036704 RepID=A0AAU7DG49_9BACT